MAQENFELDNIKNQIIDLQKSKISYLATAFT